MPLYDYRCDKCGGTIEVLQKFSDEPLTVHEGCGGGLEKLISAPALQFKGTGWYVTDYAKGGKSPSTSSNGHSEKKGESKTSETKSESKPAAGSSKSEK
jgi:putative FmdB family regulatory protein